MKNLKAYLMLISFIPLVASILYSIYIPPMSMNQHLEYEGFVQTIFSDTTGNFHEDFDSVYTFNGTCVTYTFKENHICHE